MLFPERPPSIETLNVTCTTDTISLTNLKIVPAPGQPPCSNAASPFYSSCTTPAPVGGNVSATFLISGTALAASMSHASLTCVICSIVDPAAAAAVAASTGIRVYPNYRTAQTTQPISVQIEPSVLPQLASVLLESSTTPGTFYVIGGPLQGSTVSLPSSLLATCQADSSTALLNATSPSWSSTSTILPCPAALDALLQLALAQQASSLPPLPLSSTIFTSRHLLLIFAPFSLFPTPPATLTVTVGAASCATNYIHPSGALASITTPPYSSLCPPTSDCQDLILPLALSITNRTFVSASVFSTPVQAVYPPLIPGDNSALLGAGGASPQLAAGLALVGLAFPQPLLASAVQSIPPKDASGLRLSQACISTDFAPAEQCLVVNGTQQPLLSISSGKVCAWGSKGDCLPCDPTKALCPGGAILLPKPGWWAPFTTSPPTEVVACPEPDSTLRCPGSASTPVTESGLYGCGLGYRGQTCAVCDVGFFASAGRCAQCPRFSSAAASSIAPIATFAAALLALALPLMLIVFLSHACSSQGSGTRVSFTSVAWPVLQLLIWAWSSVQGLAALFTQAQDIAPSQFFIDLFKGLSALQFQGITLNPACVLGSPPFAAFWGAFYAVIVLLVALVGGALRKAAAEASAAKPRVTLPALPTTSSSFSLSLFLSIAAGSCITIGYGALTSLFFNTAVCTVPASMSVSSYLTCQSDGTALAASGVTDIPYNDLLSALQSPLAASKNGGSAVLQATLHVSVLASDAFQVCGERNHKPARWAAMCMLVVFSAGVPCACLLALWLQGSQRHAAAKLGAGPDKEKAGTESDPPTLPPPASFSAVLLSALLDSTFRAPYEWLTCFQLGVLGCITGFLSAVRANLPLTSFIAWQASLGGLCVLSACLFFLLPQAFAKQHAWKRPGIIMLYLVTAATAGLNALLRGGMGVSSAQKLVAAYSIVGLSLLLVVVLLGSWLQSLCPTVCAGSCGRKRKPLCDIVEPIPAALTATSALPANGPAGSDPSAFSIENPVLVEEATWCAIVDENGDQYWYCAATQASEWALPPGAITQCGWRLSAGQWVNAATGLTQSTAPTVTPTLASQWSLKNDPAAAPEAQKRRRGRRRRSKRTEAAASDPPPPEQPAVWERVTPENPLEPPYWHQRSTGESAWTLPPGAQTSCGWRHQGELQQWHHAETGAVSLAPPSASSPTDAALERARERLAALREGHEEGREWVRGEGERAWVQPSSGAVLEELPGDARTACGWWRSRALNLWIHSGSGATSALPPALSSAQANSLIQAHLRVMEAARQL